ADSLGQGMRCIGKEASCCTLAMTLRLRWLRLQLSGKHSGLPSTEQGCSDGKLITTTRTSSTGRNGRLISVTAGVACGRLEATRTRAGRILSTLCHSKDF